MKGNKEKLKGFVEALNALPGNVPEYGTAAQIDPEAQPLWEIDGDALNPFAELPPLTTWATIAGSPTLSKKGIISVSAKPKQGKSMGVYALLCSLISGKPFGSIIPQDRPNLVVIFDFEMSRLSLQKRLKGVAATIGADALKRFIVFPMNAVPKADRVKFIEAKTRLYNPDIVVLDTITRLLDNFNAVEEAYPILDNWLNGTYAQERSVIAVIHENKAKDDDNMTGHLGSAIAQFQCEAYKVAKEKGVFRMWVKEARDWETSEEEFQYIIGEEGQFIDAAAVTAERLQEEKAAWMRDFGQLFGDDDELNHSTLTARIQEKQGVGRTAAQNKVKRAVEIGALCREERKGRNNQKNVFFTLPI